jgi:2-keto-4-pentenoate hydratase/2-oxohepta-3-ene-1,7-dioic acid hydratase in catechol pathway
VRIPVVSAGAAASRAVIDLHPSKIVCVGVNYRPHAEEMGKQVPEEPLLFLKAPSALIADGEPIPRPRGYDRVDYEGELAVVIGQRARRIPAARALDVVLGFTILNDVTVRDLQKRDGQWTRAKGFDGFCPLGPRIVSELDPAELRLTTRLNGSPVQDSNTSHLIFSVASLIAFVTRHMTLEPGDILSTGTPSGVGNLAPGDRVEVEIEGIGILENPVVDDPGEAA